MAAPASSVPALVPPFARVQSVWEVCQRIKGALGQDGDLSHAWVRGEVSGVKVAQSGHAYFTLKDEHAQLACVVFSARSKLRFELQDGLGVICYGRVGMYEGRGQVQLVAEEVHPDGHGARHLAFEQLKARLAQEGLFAPERKRPLPEFPERIALVTSLQAAALRDMLRILAARWPLTQVVVRNVRVQGDGAAHEIAAAIEHVNRHRAADVLIVGRGGGSIEDLWAFNEEPVARAIHASTIPVISAVGHETDTTIADFVADHRAATPSNAAERVVPDREDLADALAMVTRRLRHAALKALAHSANRLDALEQRAALRKPQRMLEAWAQRLDEAALALDMAMDQRLRDAGDRLSRGAALLDSYSPLRTLRRGYAIVTTGGAPVTSVAQLRPGSSAEVQVADGKVRTVVTGDA